MTGIAVAAPSNAEQDTSFVYYLAKPGKLYQLRQTRFKAQFAQGTEHPHDVCAVARSKDEMRTMLVSSGITGCVDWNSVE